MLLTNATNLKANGEWFLINKEKKSCMAAQNMLNSLSNFMHRHSILRRFCNLNLQDLLWHCKRVTDVLKICMCTISSTTYFNTSCETVKQTETIKTVLWKSAIFKRQSQKVKNKTGNMSRSPDITDELLLFSLLMLMPRCLGEKMKYQKKKKRKH